MYIVVDIAALTFSPGEK